MNAYRQLKRAIGRLPGVLQIRRRLYDRAFTNLEKVNLYRGVFETFEAAASGAPRTKPLGYDNAASAEMYDDIMEPTLRDYPALFWLQRALDAGHGHVFDLGGHVGIKYYAFRQRLRTSAAMRWLVCDVPAVAARGARLATERGVADRLRFTSDWREMGSASTLYASGSLQYLPHTLPEMLGGLEQMPARLIINTTPLHPARTFFTLNSIGNAFCPYRVQSEPEFMRAIVGLGYTCVDRWDTPRDFSIPFEPGHEQTQFVGLAFER